MRHSPNAHSGNTETANETLKLLTRLKQHVNRFRAKCFRINIHDSFTIYIIPPQWVDTVKILYKYLFYIATIMGGDVLARSQGINNHDIDLVTPG